jgi:hypothetical protein
MFHTPELILFKVEINGKQYYGRPNTLYVENFFKPNPNQKALFYTYVDERSYLQGNRDGEIQVTALEIKGLEAIDTVKREPLDKILFHCNELSKCKQDMWYISKAIPKILSELIIAIEEYEDIHSCKKYEVLYDDIEEIVNNCNAYPINAPEMSRSNLVRDIKEKISYRIDNLIEFSARYYQVEA